jgi:hypothetical protein
LGGYESLVKIPLVKLLIWSVIRIRYI